MLLQELGTDGVLITRTPRVLTLNLEQGWFMGKPRVTGYWKGFSVLSVGPYVLAVAGAGA